MGFISAYEASFTTTSSTVKLGRKARSVSASFRFLEALELSLLVEDKAVVDRASFKFAIKNGLGGLNPGHLTLTFMIGDLSEAKRLPCGGIPGVDAIPCL